MADYIIEFLPVKSASYGEYTIMKLKGIAVKELKNQPALMLTIGKIFGARFVIVKEEEGKERDYFLSENIIGVPTPEFERQLKSVNWQKSKIEVENG